MHNLPQTLLDCFGKTNCVGFHRQSRRFDLLPTLKCSVLVTVPLLIHQMLSPKVKSKIKTVKVNSGILSPYFFMFLLFLFIYMAPFFFSILQCFRQSAMLTRGVLGIIQIIKGLINCQQLGPLYLLLSCSHPKNVYFECQFFQKRHKNQQLVTCHYFTVRNNLNLLICLIFQIVFFFYRKNYCYYYHDYYYFHS